MHQRDEIALYLELDTIKINKILMLRGKSKE